MHGDQTLFFRIFFFLLFWKMAHYCRGKQPWLKRLMTASTAFCLYPVFAMLSSHGQVSLH